MDVSGTLYVIDREDWREWLRLNHSSREEIWLVYYKKHTNKPRIPYDHAVEEAICFGWIDSTVKRVDEEIFIQKFSPRKKNSKWSDLNKERAIKMIELGKMETPGKDKLKGIDLQKRDESSTKPEIAPPDYFLKILNNKPKALSFFNQLAPSYRKAYLEWITGAKKEETRIRRAMKAISFLEKNTKLPMM